MADADQRKNEAPPATPAESENTSARRGLMKFLGYCLLHQQRSDLAMGLAESLQQYAELNSQATESLNRCAEQARLFVSVIDKTVAQPAEPRAKRGRKDHTSTAEVAGKGEGAGKIQGEPPQATPTASAPPASSLKAKAADGAAVRADGPPWEEEKEKALKEAEEAAVAEVAAVAEKAIAEQDKKKAAEAAAVLAAKVEKAAAPDKMK